MTANQVQVSQGFSEFTHYEDEHIQDEFVILHGYGKIRRAYTPDQYLPPSSVQKYTYYYPYKSNKNASEKYTRELPTNTTNHLIFRNIYYEGNNRVWIYQDDSDEMSEVSSSSYENYSHSLPEDQNYLIHVEENISGTNPLFF